MKIFFPDIHITLTKNLSLSLEKLGHQLIIPSEEYEISELPPQGWAWNKTHSKKSTEKYGFAKNTIYASKEEILDMKPEVIFVSAFENQFEVINVLWQEAKKWGAKLAFYSGNDYWDTAYPWDIIQNYMPADQLAARLCEKNKKHYFHYRPWIDYEMFSYEGVSDSDIIGTYICNYKNNFPEDFECYNKIKKATSANYLLCEDKSKKETAEVMKKSCATLHIKRLEGYGFAVIESMAKGRPVFFWEPLTEGKSYLQWLKLGVTAFTFRDLGDYTSQLNFFLSNKEFRNEVQLKCSKKIREIINNEEQNTKLNNFLNNLL
tara:strand:+ start:5766 stop:6722 length:957 start_codon:yes stop_codon:yes gene_type:complete